MYQNPENAGQSQPQIDPCSAFHLIQNGLLNSLLIFIFNEFPQPLDNVAHRFVAVRRIRDIVKILLSVDVAHFKQDRRLGVVTDDKEIALVDAAVFESQRSEALIDAACEFK